jgi:tetratricopeptide (TPR) repeat protein
MYSALVSILLSGITAQLDQAKHIQINQQAPGNCNTNIVVIGGSFTRPPLPSPCTGEDPAQRKRLHDDVATLLHQFPQLQNKVNSIQRSNLALAAKDRQINMLMNLVQSHSDPVLIQTHLGKSYSQAIQKGDLRGAQAILEQLATSEHERHTTAKADIEFKMAQMAVLSDKPHEGLAHSKRAYDLKPDNPDYSSSYAVLLGEQGQYSEAEQVLNHTLIALRANAKTDPGLLPALEMNLNNLGATCAERHKDSEAVSALTEALQIERVLAITNKATYQPDIALTQLNLGSVYVRSGKLPLATEAAKEAQLIYHDLAKDDPMNYGAYLCAALNLAGTIFREEHRPTDAANAFEAAHISYLQLAAESSNSYHHEIAVVCLNLGQLFSDAMSYDPVRADNEFTDSLGIYRDLVKTNPDAYSEELAYLRNAMGLLYLGYPSDRLRDAEEAFSEAEAIRRHLVKKDGSAYLPDLAATLNDRGNLNSVFVDDPIRLQQAFDEYDESLKIRHDLDRESPGTYSESIAGTLGNKAILLMTMKQPGAASVAFKDAIALWKVLATKDPIRFNYRLAEALNNAGDNYEDSGQLDLAESVYIEAYNIRDKLAASEPKYRADLAVTENNLGILYKDAKKMDKAAEYYSKSLTVYEELSKEDASFFPMVARVYNNRGKVYNSIGKVSEGRRDCQKASEIYKGLAEQDRRFSKMVLATCVP